MPRESRKPRPQGNGRQPCVHCTLRSIAGMKKGQGLCPYHWAVQAWRKTWADSLYLPGKEQG